MESNEDKNYQNQKLCPVFYLGGQDHFHSVKGNCQIVAIQEWIYKGTIRHSVENHPRKNVKILYTNTLLCETCKSPNFLIFWSMHKQEFSHSEFQKHDFHISIKQTIQPNTYLPTVRPRLEQPQFLRFLPIAT